MDLTRLAFSRWRRAASPPPNRARSGDKKGAEWRFSRVASGLMGAGRKIAYVPALEGYARCQTVGLKYCFRARSADRPWLMHLRGHPGSRPAWTAYRNHRCAKCRCARLTRCPSMLDTSLKPTPPTRRQMGLLCVSPMPLRWSLFGN
jgi:hypothetical protein